MTFDNVKIIKKANQYFDGKVTSRTVEFEDGTLKTLGIMMPGEYLFTTSDAEDMEIMAGECEVKLKGEDRFRTIEGGENFDVPANSSFDIKVNTLVDYCCHYIK